MQCSGDRLNFCQAQALRQCMTPQAKVSKGWRGPKPTTACHVMLLPLRALVKSMGEAANDFAQLPLPEASLHCKQHPLQFTMQYTVHCAQHIRPICYAGCMMSLRCTELHLSCPAQRAHTATLRHGAQATGDRRQRHRLREGAGRQVWAV